MYTKLSRIIRGVKGPVNNLECYTYKIEKYAKENTEENEAAFQDQLTECYYVPNHSNKFGVKKAARMCKVGKGNDTWMDDLVQKKGRCKSVSGIVEENKQKFNEDASFICFLKENSPVFDTTYPSELVCPPAREKDIKIFIRRLKKLEKLIESAVNNVVQHDNATFSLQKGCEWKGESKYVIFFYIVNLFRRIQFIEFAFEKNVFTEKYYFYLYFKRSMILFQKLTGLSVKIHHPIVYLNKFFLPQNSPVNPYLFQNLVLFASIGVQSKAPFDLLVPWYKTEHIKYLLPSVFDLKDNVPLLKVYGSVYLKYCEFVSSQIVQGKKYMYKLLVECCKKLNRALFHENRDFDNVIENATFEVDVLEDKQKSSEQLVFEIFYHLHNKNKNVKKEVGLEKLKFWFESDSFMIKKIKITTKKTDELTPKETRQLRRRELRPMEPSRREPITTELRPMEPSEGALTKKVLNVGKKVRNSFLNSLSKTVKSLIDFKNEIQTEYSKFMTIPISGRAAAQQQEEKSETINPVPSVVSKKVKKKIVTIKPAQQEKSETINPVPSVVSKTPKKKRKRVKRKIVTIKPAPPRPVLASGVQSKN